MCSARRSGHEARDAAPAAWPCRSQWDEITGGGAGWFEGAGPSGWRQRRRRCRRVAAEHAAPAAWPRGTHLQRVERWRAAGSASRVERDVGETGAGKRFGRGWARRRGRGEMLPFGINGLVPEDAYAHGQRRTFGQQRTCGQQRFECGCGRSQWFQLGWRVRRGGWRRRGKTIRRVLCRLLRAFAAPRGWAPAGPDHSSQNPLSRSWASF